MAKTFNPTAQDAIKRVNATIPNGANWKQSHSCNAALIIAETLLLGVGKRAEPDVRKAMMTALNDVVNPSALAQAMDKLDATDPCYRKRVSEVVLVDDPA